MRNLILLVALAVTTRWAAQGGAAEPPTTRPYVLHLPGVGGVLFVDYELATGLRLSGLKADFQMYDWTCNDPGIDALHAIDRNKKQAQLMADRINNRLKLFPGSRVVLTAHSGGGAIAIWTLERLPENVQADDCILLSPAISPAYDLTTALKHVKGNLYCFSSTGDGVVLGMGCRIAGTMDGLQTNAAGMVGFTRPISADPQQYEKLVPCPYDPQWARLDNEGDHVGSMSVDFVRTIVSPLVKGEDGARERATTGTRQAAVHDATPITP